MKSHYADYLLACCSLARTGDTMRGQQRSGWFHQSGEIPVTVRFYSYFLLSFCLLICVLSTSCQTSFSICLVMVLLPASERLLFCGCPRQVHLCLSPGCSLFFLLVVFLSEYYSVSVLWKRTALKSIQRNCSGVFFQSKDESGVSVDNSWFGPFSHSNGSIKTQARSCRNDQLLLPAQYWRWSFPLSCFRCPPPAGLNKTACLI